MGKTVYQMSPDGGTTKYNVRDNNIAPIEFDATSASKTYYKNDEFVLDSDGVLYRATTTISAGSAIVTSGGSANAEVAPSVTGQIKALDDRVDVLEEESGAVLLNASGNPIVIDNGVEANAERLKVTLEPIQSGSGTPSPDNVRPISGRTGTTVTTRNEGSTESNTITLQFGQTVCGGEVDFDTGVVTVTKAIADLGSMTWTDYQTNCKTSNDIQSVVAKPRSGSALADIIAEKYPNSLPSAVVADQTTKAQICVNINGTIIVSDGGTSASPSGKICYELATPTTIQLTPEQLKLLKGYNYVAADGDISLAYYGEMQPVIDKLDEEKVDTTVIGNVEDGANASQAYAVGSHFIRGGKFCTVTSPVTTGSTWTLNTNYVEGTIADNLSYEDGTFTIGTAQQSNVSILHNANDWWRWGKVVNFVINFTIANDINGVVSLFQPKYKPHQQTTYKEKNFILCDSSAPYGATEYSVYMVANGWIKTSTAGLPAGSYALCGEYICE